MVLLTAAFVPAIRAQSAVARSPMPDAPMGVTAFVGVNVVPMDAEHVLANQAVLVAGSGITALGPSAKVKVPAGATRIDGRGKHLVPGLAALLRTVFYEGITRCRHTVGWSLA